MTSLLLDKPITKSKKAPKKILFIGESISLAHVVRPYTLAKHMKDLGYEVHFASSNKYDNLIHFNNTVHIDSVSSAYYFGQIAKGKTIYTEQILKTYIKDEIEIISKISPDLIVADCRPTLNISAKILKIPFINLCNAYWSPFSTLECPIPNIPVTRLLGDFVSQRLMPYLTPKVMAHQCAAFRKVQDYWGLNQSEDIRKMYTDGDATVFMDIPALAPTQDLPSNSHYIGPVLWEPETRLPDWDLNPNKKTIYISMNSSGGIKNESLERQKEKLIASLLERDYQIITNQTINNNNKNNNKNKNLYTAKMIPGIQASAKANLVICHGGSGTIYQALSAGKPIIGFCSNLDQQLGMRGVEKAGAGISYLSNESNMSKILQDVDTLIHSESVKNTVQKLRTKINNCHAKNNFLKIAQRYSKSVQ